MCLTIRRFNLVNNPLISVIIPTYNRAYCLAESINSVLNQTYLNIELIIVDDGSTDNTSSVVSLINDNRIRYIKLPINSGACRARNIGIKKARGEFITFNDSDDVWKKNKLEEQYNYYLKKPDGIMYFCKFEKISSNEKKVVAEFPDSHHISLLSNCHNYTTALLQGNFIGTPAIFIKRESIIRLNYFDEKLSTHEDWDFVLRASTLGKIYYYDKVLVDVYSNDKGVNQVCSLNKILSLFRILNKFWVMSDKKEVFNGFFDIINKYLSENDISILEDINGTSKEEIINHNYYFQILMYVYFRKVTEYNKSICDYKTYIENVENIDKKLKDNEKLVSFEKKKKKLIEKIVQIFYEDTLRTKLFPEFIVYGVGDVGLCLIALSLKAGIKIPFTIDKRNKSLENISCCSIEEIPKTDLPIVITAYDPEHSIKCTLSSYVSAPIYYLEDLLKE